jgi:hypothetical protein
MTVQPVPPVSVRRERAPTPKDSKRAIANLIELEFNSMPKRPSLEAAGFREEGGAWRHADGSWVRRVSRGGALEFGVGSDRLTELPRLVPSADPAAGRVQTRPSLVGKNWAWFRANTALGRLRAPGDGIAARVAVLRAGFVFSERKGREETWTHPDGSWVRIVPATGVSQRGWNGYGVAELQSGNPRVRLLEERPPVPRSMKSRAIAKLGRVGSNDAARLCKQAGFEKAGKIWIHEDGSWVKVDQGYVTVGWKGYTLDDLPYHASGGWR